jgi:hypothetical protein
MDNDYLALRAWCNLMGSYQYYTDNQVRQARATKAPQDVIYRRTDSLGKPLGWARIKDIKDLDTRADVKALLDIQEQLNQ